MPFYTDMLWPFALAIAMRIAVAGKQIRLGHLRKGRRWVRPHILDHATQGAWAQLLPYFKDDDENLYFNFLRMQKCTFNIILFAIEDDIRRMTTNMHKCISPAERLGTTLRFLGTGDSYTSIAYLFRVGKSTVGEIVPEVCQAIYVWLAKVYMKCPNRPSQWKKVANGFRDRWQLPNCICALDGKHIPLIAPKNSGPQYLNYKRIFSIVLMALVDSDYQFIYVDIGSNGRVCDGGIFDGSPLQQALKRRSSKFPQPEPLPGDDLLMPFYICADNAFPLTHNIMKPYNFENMDYAHRIYNYRLSRGRRVVENVFGICANKWRVLLKRMYLEPDKAVHIVQACCVLHNIVRLHMGYRRGEIDRENGPRRRIRRGRWRSDPRLDPAHFPTGTNTRYAATLTRDYLRDYFSSPTGAVPWQNDKR